MEKQLLELFETAKSAADAAAAPGGGPADESRCIDSLTLLKSFPVSFKILSDTQVGKRLQILKRHPRKKIKAFVVDLIDAWKKIVTEESNRNKKTGKSENKPVKPSGKLVIVKTAKVVNQQAKMVKSHTCDSVLTVQEKQPSDVLLCNDGARYNLRKLLMEGLCKVDGEADESTRDKVKACDLPGVAISVESALFDKWRSCTGPNRARYRSVVFNLKDKANPDFRRKVLLGDIKAESIPSMTTEEMGSDKRRLEIQLIRNRALYECERGGKQKGTTKEFKCGRCGQRDCTYYQMQTRSADEPMTTYVTCQNCDKKWKFC